MTWYRSSAGVNSHAEDEMNERVIIYTKNWYFLGLKIFTCILNCLFHIRGKNFLICHLKLVFASHIW